MTLSTRIAALTGPDRAIDAEVADLIGWWPQTHRKLYDVKYHREWRCNKVSEDAIECPRFTTSLDATLAEIRRRGWEVSLDDIGGLATCLICCPKDEKQLTQSVRAHPQGRGPIPSTFEGDDNLTLAALEALVRAVEGQG